MVDDDRAVLEGETAVDDLLLREKLVERYVGEGKSDEAVKHLFDLIAEHALRQDFRKAEALRNRIFKIDPLALPEIVKSAELIQAARKRSIGDDYRQVWFRLLQELSDEEANALLTRDYRAPYVVPEKV
jgi:hypothetical protein